MAKKAFDMSEILSKYKRQENLEMISTSIPALDEILGGGISLGYCYGYYAQQGTGKCLSVNHRVSTSKGYRKGKDLVKGKPEGFTEENSLKVEQSDGSFVPISHYYVQNKANCCKFSLHYGNDVVVTPEHPILAITKDYCIPHFVKARDLKQGDYVLKRKFQRIHFDKYDSLTYLKYFLYGFAVGDASYGETNFTNNNCVGYTGYPEDLVWIRSVEERYAGAIREDGGRYAFIGQDRTTPTMRIPLAKSLLKELILRSENSINKQFDESVFDDKSLAMAFFLGYYSSDGTIETKSNNCTSFEISTSSKEMAYQICDLLDYLSIIYRVQFDKESFYYDKQGNKIICTPSARFTIPKAFFHNYVRETAFEFESMFDFSNTKKIGRLFRQFHKPITNIEINRCSHIGKPVRMVLYDLINTEYPHWYCHDGDTHKCWTCSNGVKSSRKDGYIFYNCRPYASWKHFKQDSYSPSFIWKYLTFLKSMDFVVEDEKLLDEEPSPFNISIYRDYVFTEIESKEEVVEDVFDVTVPTTHLFMANNLVNHNTSICLQTIRSFCKKGYRCLIIDVEKSINDLQLKSFQLDLFAEQGLLDIITLTYFNELEEVVKAVSQADYKLVLIDSLSAVVPYIDKNSNATLMQIGIRARQASNLMMQLKAWFYDAGIASLIIFQARAAIGGAWGGPDMQSAGSYTEKHMVDALVRMASSSKIKDDDGKIIGNKVWIEAEKCKFTAPFQRKLITLIFGKGVSRRIDIVDFALNHGILVPSGRSYVVPETGEIAKSKRNIYDLSNESLRVLERLNKEYQDAHPDEVAEDAM